MTYHVYLEELERRLKYFCEKGEDIHRVCVLKNNGVRADGFSLRRPGRREQPTVYVNHYFQKNLTEEELEGFAGKVWQVLKSSPELPDEELAMLLDYARIQSYLFCRLISRERNEELLEKVPWLPLLDMAVVFYIRVPEHIVRNATSLIGKEQMERWGVTSRQLYRRAYRNLLADAVELYPMEDYLGELGLHAEPSGMYILGNERREYGAAVILNPKTLKLCWERLGEDFYLLPSSIHEWILLPESLGDDRKALDRLVQEVNESCVSREEYLSSHAYLYSGASGKIIF